MTSVEFTWSREKLNKIGFVDCDGAYETSSIHIYSTKYRSGDDFPIDPGILTGNPISEKITEILILQIQQVFFLCQYFLVEWLDAALNAYRISEIDDVSFINSESLADFKPLSIWYDFQNNEQHICIRRILI